MRKPQLVKIGDQLVKLITISALAEKLHRSTKYVYKLEERNILPQANFRGEEKRNGDKVIQGERLYSIELADKLAEVFSGISQGVQITAQQQQQINIIFQDERLKYIK